MEFFAKVHTYLATEGDAKAQLSEAMVREKKLKDKLLVAEARAENGVY
jgi:hypothetical protein